jgi:hypothetical protein
MSFLMYTLCQRTVGLRVTAEVEALGMDISKHGGAISYHAGMPLDQSNQSALKSASFEASPRVPVEGASSADEEAKDLSDSMRGP